MVLPPERARPVMERVGHPGAQGFDGAAGSREPSRDAGSQVLATAWPASRHALMRGIAWAVALSALFWWLLLTMLA